jgi:hypothetical protein
MITPSSRNAHRNRRNWKTCPPQIAIAWQACKDTAPGAGRSFDQVEVAYRVDCPKQLLIGVRKFRCCAGRTRFFLHTRVTARHDPSHSAFERMFPRSLAPSPSAAPG